MKVIIDGSRHVTMRTIDYVLRPDRDGGEERVRCSIGPTGGRVIHQIEPSADVALPQIPKLIQLCSYLLPRPVKWLDFDVIGIDQLLIRHQIGALFTQR